MTENVDEMHDRYSYTEIVNKSMNQVLMRSINTSMTSLIPVGSLLIVGSFLFGATSLLEFAIALFIGIAIGTYSSIFVATPLLAMWKETEEEWIANRKRAERRRSGGAEPRYAKKAVPATDVTPEKVESAPSKAGSAASGPAGATARAPRKRKKRR